MRVCFVGQVMAIMLAGIVRDVFLVRVRCLFLVMALSLLAIPFAAGTDSLDTCTPADLALYLSLAQASERSYDDAQPGLETTPSGSVALVREDADRNLIIAFRGSLIQDRTPEHRFSTFGKENIRRNYRDWVATNLKQTAGFLPRQYVEAAALVEKHVLRHPADKRVFITGHSKGGGAATYAYVAVNLSANVSVEQAGRMGAVTFNAAVVREQNWRRLIRRLDPAVDVEEREPLPGAVIAVCMAGDPVSKINSREERPYVRRIIINPAGELSSGEQHSISAVIDELQRFTAF